MVDSPRTAGKSDPIYYQVSAFALSPDECEILYVPLNSDGEGNGTPLQYSCLANHVGGGAW